MSKPPVKAQQLADTIGREVRAGRPEPGGWMPSERQLADVHGVVRSTVRQALKLLEDGGLIEHVQGSGFRVPERATVADGESDDAADLATVRRELQAINARLGEINTRLAAIERHRPETAPQETPS